MGAFILIMLSLVVVPLLLVLWIEREEMKREILNQERREHR